MTSDDPSQYHVWHWELGLLIFILHILIQASWCHEPLFSLVLLQNEHIDRKTCLDREKRLIVIGAHHVSLNAYQPGTETVVWICNLASSSTRHGFCSTQRFKCHITLVFIPKKTSQTSQKERNPQKGSQGFVSLPCLKARVSN